MIDENKMTMLLTLAWISQAYSLQVINIDTKLEQ